MSADVKLKWFPGPALKKVEGAIDSASLEAAKLIAKKARQEVPQDTGTLKQTIKAVKSKFKLGGALVVAGSRVIGGAKFLRGQDRTKAGAFYAQMVEFGTVKMKARSFMRKALYGSRLAVERIMKKKIGVATK